MTRPLILFFPFPLLSHYARCLILANDIRNDFDIQFAHEEKYSSLISGFGFSTFTCEKFDAEKVMEHSRRFDFSWLNENDLKKIFSSQAECIVRLKAALVVGDANFTLRMAAEKSGVKMISLINGYMSRYYLLTRRISRTHSAYPYSKKLPQRFFDLLTGTMESVAFRKVHAPFRRIRRQYHLNMTRQYLEELEGDLTFICDLPELFPQKNLPSTHQFIGPIFYKSPQTESEIISKLSPQKRTILVSMGSTGDWEKLKGLTDEKFHQFNIVTAGDQKETLKGPHITGKKFLENDAVLPHVNLVICHGGNGTIYQALAHQVPVLGLTSIFEQEWNMDRIEELGLGQCINDAHDSDQMLSMIQRWINIKPKTDFTSLIAAYNSDRRAEIFRRAAQFD